MSEAAATIVLIEDERQIRRFVRASLEAEGMTVYDGETGKAGLIEAATRKPDRVIVESATAERGVGPLARRKSALSAHLYGASIWRICGASASALRRSPSTSSPRPASDTA